MPTDMSASNVIVEISNKNDRYPFAAHSRSSVVSVNNSKQNQKELNRLLNKAIHHVYRNFNNLTTLESRVISGSSTEAPHQNHVTSYDLPENQQHMRRILIYMTNGPGTRVFAVSPNGNIMKHVRNIYRNIEATPSQSFKAHKGMIYMHDGKCVHNKNRKCIQGTQARKLLKKDFLFQSNSTANHGHTKTIANMKNVHGRPYYHLNKNINRDRFKQLITYLQEIQKNQIGNRSSTISDIRTASRKRTPSRSRSFSRSRSPSRSRK